jgi:hypothetical protein
MGEGPCPGWVNTIGLTDGVVEAFEPLRAGQAAGSSPAVVVAAPAGLSPAAGSALPACSGASYARLLGDLPGDTFKPCAATGAMHNDVRTGPQ